MSKRYAPPSQRNAFRFDFVTKYLSLFGLLIFLGIMLFPFFLITINSFKTEAEYLASGPFSLPEHFDLDAIKETWERTEYSTKLLNSFFISTSTAVLAVTLSLLNAFALGIGKIKGRR